MLHTYPSDYKVIFVGDAAMSPYEITHPGGSVEHFNEESGMLGSSVCAMSIPSSSGSIRRRRRIGATRPPLISFAD